MEKTIEQRIDEYFNKVDPKELIQEYKKLGYTFRSNIDYELFAIFKKKYGLKSMSYISRGHVNRLIKGIKKWNGIFLITK